MSWKETVREQVPTPEYDTAPSRKLATGKTGSKMTVLLNAAVGIAALDVAAFDIALTGPSVSPEAAASTNARAFALESISAWGQAWEPEDWSAFRLKESVRPELWLEIDLSASKNCETVLFKLVRGAV